MSGEALAALSGVVIQLVFAYFPGIADWYEKQTGNVKGGLQLGVLAVLVFGGFLPVCLGWFQQIPVTCDQAGIEQAVVNFFLAVAANQTIYLTAVRPHKAAQKSGVKPE